LRVTEIAIWRSNPYAIYARHVLGLRPLEELDRAPDASEFGTLVHRAIEAFLKLRAAGPLPPTALEELLEAGRREFRQISHRAEVWAFWRPRFARIADWFVRQEAGRRGDLVRVAIEARGTAALEAGRAPFVLTGAADRIDIRRDGTLVVADYKTGTLPSATEVAGGWNPQLPLLAALIGLGGFAADHGIAADAPVVDLEYWRLTGRRAGGEIKSVLKGSGAQSLAGAALEGLERLIVAFDNPAHPYAARPFAGRTIRFDDYDHLARVDEWSDRQGEGEQ
jgi:ATP-dependent helicase/nuclease subunit B